MKLKFSRILAVTGVVALAAFATAAEARVGVSLGLSVPLGGPVYAPAPVYMAPQPAYVAPQGYYAPAPVAYAAQPVYVAPPPPVYYAPPTVGVYFGSGHGYGGYHHGGGHRGHWR